MSIEANNLVSVESLPLTLDPTTSAYLANRTDACIAAAAAISALPPVINLFQRRGTVDRRAAGHRRSTVSGNGAWGSTGEAPPSGTTLPDGAVLAAQAWQTIANAIFTLNGNALLPQYDTAARQFRCASVIAQNLTDTQSGPFAVSALATPPVPLTNDQGVVLTDDLGNILYANPGTTGDYTWSTVVALPTLLLDVATLNAPVTLSSQQVSVIRYALGTQVQQLAQLLLSFRSQNVTQPATANLRNSESLMDLAGAHDRQFRELDPDSRAQQTRAALARPDKSIAGTSGRTLFTAGNGITPTNQPTYAANVLGTDYDFGPINGQMPPGWGTFRSLPACLTSPARSAAGYKHPWAR